MVLAGAALILSYAVAILAWLMLRRAGAFTPTVAGAWGVAVIASSSLVFFAEHPVLRALTFICGALVALRVYSSTSTSTCLVAAGVALSARCLLFLRLVVSCTS
jgi:hypothetical protein